MDNAFSAYAWLTEKIKYKNPYSLPFFVNDCGEYAVTGLLLVLFRDAFGKYYKFVYHNVFKNINPAANPANIPVIARKIIFDMY